MKLFMYEDGELGMGLIVPPRTIEIIRGRKKHVRMALNLADKSCNGNFYVPEYSFLNPPVINKKHMFAFRRRAIDYIEEQNGGT